MNKLFERLLGADDRRIEFIRFCMVGGVATVLHYGIYLLLLHTVMKKGIWLDVAYTIGYCTSLVCNFFMTTYFTFRSHASVKRATGFGFSHFVNYMLHMVLFNVFIHLGVNEKLAPAFVLMIAVPVNYTLLHFVFKHKRQG